MNKQWRRLQTGEKVEVGDFFFEADGTRKDVFPHYAHLVGMKMNGGDIYRYLPAPDSMKNVPEKFLKRYFDIKASNKKRGEKLDTLQTIVDQFFISYGFGIGGTNSALTYMNRIRDVMEGK